VRHVTALVLLLVVGCGKPKSRERDAGEAASVELVRIRVDGDEVAALDATKLGARPRLRDVLPEDDRDPAEWTHVGATARGRRSLSLWEPAKARPDQEIHLYVANGEAAVGLFRAAPPGASPELIAELEKPRIELTEVELIDVHTVPPPPSPREQLVATVDGVQVPLDLGALPRMEKPKGTRGHARAAWSLQTIAAALAPGKKIASVRVGEREVPADQLGVAELRINRRGELGLDINAGARERGPRGIRTIDVVTVK
jgi:hypothetical protein